jgi:phenylpropionate dioxygenase-like ring-hydroxylating dioxygenase large terminal subunit
MMDGQGGSGVAERWERYAAAVDGLPEYWYPIMKSSRLARKPVARRLLGRDLVLVRHAGRAYALDDRCAHRQFPLSAGRCEFPGHLMCIYHGWTYDVTTGVLKAALPDGPDCPLVGKVKVRSYPVEERAGMVFVWMGEGEPVPVEDDLPAELLRPDARVHVLMRDCPGNWRYASENGFDEAHNKVLHRRGPWVMFRRLPAWNETEIVKTEDGKWLARRQRSIHATAAYPGLGEWPKFGFWQRRARTTMAGNDHTVAIRLPCLLRVRQPGRANWTHFNWYMPVERGRYRDVAVAVAWVAGWRRLLWSFRYWTYIYAFHRYHFLRQDIRAIGLMPESHPVPAFRPDVSITAWRRLVEDEARRPSGPTRDEAPPVAAE